MKTLAYLVFPALLATIALGCGDTEEAERPPPQHSAPATQLGASGARPDDVPEQEGTRGTGSDTGKPTPQRNARREPPVGNVPETTGKVVTGEEAKRLLDQLLKQRKDGKDRSALDKGSARAVVEGVLEGKKPSGRSHPDKRGGVLDEVLEQLR